MSESNIVPTPDIGTMTDRELVEATYASQLRVEMMVSQAIANLAPTVEAFTKGGIMGLLGKMR